MNKNKLIHSAPIGANLSWAFTLRRRKKSTIAYHPPPLILYEEFRGCGRFGPPEGRNKIQKFKT